MTSCCLVVLGHVDHGKTSLVRALTGAETDRLPEEKARGLSIVPGFAHRHYSSGTVDFIDAPGHADFIQATVAGASGASAALIVVSALDGVEAQTKEHMEIARLMGIDRAIVAVTKSDLGAPPALAPEIRAAIGTAGFALSPIIPCSAKTMFGIDHLHAEIEGLLTQSTARPSRRPPHLAIDRVFSEPGHGTVVTGTLLGSALSLSDALMLYPAERPVRIRGLQCRGQDVAEAAVGTRLAINLRGVSAQDIARGNILSAPGALAPSTVMDIALRMLPEEARDLRPLQEVRAHFGTSTVVAELRPYRGGTDGEALPEFAQLRLRSPACCYTGQPMVLRALSPARTVGGAIVLDPVAKPSRAKNAMRTDVLRGCETQDPQVIASALAETGAGTLSLADLARLSGRTLDNQMVSLGARFVHIAPGVLGHAQEIGEVQDALWQQIATYHAENPLRPGAPRGVLASLRAPAALRAYAVKSLVEAGKLRAVGPDLALADHDPRNALSPAQVARMTEIESTVATGGLNRPITGGYSDGAEDAHLLDILLMGEDLVALHNVSLDQRLIFHTDTLAAAAATLRAAFPEEQPFTTGAARTVLGTSRRIIVPVLEHFDATGLTRRDGDTRCIIPA